MRVSAAGRAFIKNEEGCVLHAYKDIAGVLTIGVGHTGPEVHAGQQITAAQADAILSEDLERFERCVSYECRLPPSQNEFDAMVSLAFNIGTAAMAQSTVLREYNAGNTQAAADAFLMWRKAGGHVAPSLLARRVRERHVFLTRYA